MIYNHILDDYSKKHYTPNVMDVNQALLNRLVGQNLRAARNAAGWTQAELAARSGVSRPSIAVIELGRQTSPLHVIYRLCLALSVELPKLLPQVEDVVVSAHDDDVDVEAGKTGKVVGELLTRLLEAEVEHGRPS